MVFGGGEEGFNSVPSLQNTVLFRIDIPHWIRQKSETNEDELMTMFRQQIPADEVATLDTIRRHI